MEIEELSELLEALTDWSSSKTAVTTDHGNLVFAQRNKIRELTAISLKLRDRHAISSWLLYLKGLKVLEQICDYSNSNFYVNLDQLKTALDSAKLLQTHTAKTVQKGLEHYIKPSAQD